MKPIPQIQKYMTSMPYSIARDVPVKEAQAVMQEHRIRHLPVLDQGKLLGIVTDRDLKLASSLNSNWEWTCGDIMSSHPYLVPPEEPLHTVLKEMAERKLGFALVQHSNGNVIGIFTEIDAYHILDELLSTAAVPRKLSTHSL